MFHRHVLMIVALSSSIASAQQYRLTVVEPTGTYPLATSGCSDISDIGRAVGANSLDGVLIPFEWTQSSGLRYVPTLTPVPDQINNRGDRVFVSSLILADGTPIEVPDHQGGPSTNNFLADLNDDLIVVGSGPGSGTTSNILVWDPVRGTRSIDIWAARAILRVNAFDQGVGYSSSSSGSSDGFVCNIDDGSYIQFNAHFSSPWSEAIDVNELGVVVGRVSTSSGVRAFVFDTRTGATTFLPELDGGHVTYVLPRAIDNKGRVVGSALTASDDWRAFLWNPVSGMTNLDTAHDQAGGTFHLIRAEDISETGVIIGRGFHGTVWGPDRGFILDEGGAWADLGLALGGASGDPTLTGVGDLTPGSGGAIELRNAPPSASGSLLVSWTYDPTRISGGVIAALPARIIIPVKTDGTGRLQVPFITPSNAPSGFHVYLQVALRDPSAPRGTALSNALRGLIP
jgi:probable HAF family extracellular repeat protein